MLNFVTLDIADRSLLENSYNSLKNKDDIKIVTNTQEKDKLFRQTIDNVKTPNNATFSFQNLLKVKLLSGQFYIAQCLVDFGYPTGSKGSQSFTPKYTFQAIGIADLKVNLGVTHLRPENKIDKFLSRFFNNDIDFDNAEKFNDKYFLVSDNKAAIIKYFDYNFLSTIAKYENVLLTTSGNQMYISFDNDLKVNQLRIIQEIFSSFKYLADK